MGMLLHQFLKIGFVLFWALTVPAKAWAAGSAMPPLVHDIGISFFAASFAAVMFSRIGIPSIAAFLVSGIIVGPVGFAWVTDPANIDTIAKLGFILLLFMIGLEIDMRKIMRSGRTIVVSGFAQYPLSVLFGFLIAKGLIFAGVAGGLLEGPYSALYFGIMIAGSSTLLVVKLFQESYELDTEPGQIALGMLIFQDFWAIVVILMQPNLSNPEPMPILASFAGIFLLVLLSVALSRSLTLVAFRWISREPKLFLVVAIGWCFAVVFMGQNLSFIGGSFLAELHLNISVDSSMSALIAGAVIANLPYSREIVAKVGVVRDFFIFLFFVALGMSIPAVAGWDVVILSLVLAGVALLCRQLIFFPLLYFTGGDQRHAQVSSIRLAQVSEFGLVIAYLGVEQQHLSADFASAIIFAFVITSLMTPLLYKHAYSMHAFMSPALAMLGFKEPPAQIDSEAKEYDLIMLGFHRVASSLLHELKRNHPEMMPRILVIDFNVKLHGAIRKMGADVHYGDLSNDETLIHAGIDRAKVVVCTIPDDILRGINNQKLVETIRKLNPGATIIANAEKLTDGERVYAAGADYVYMGRVKTARALEEVIANTLNGSLDEFRQKQEERHGAHRDRSEVLR